MIFVEKFIYKSSWKLFYTVLAILLIVKSGIWFIPNLDVYRQVSLDPFLNPFIKDTNAQYLVWSWLGNYLAWVLGVKTFGAFFTLHICFSIAFLASIAIWIRKNFSAEGARVATIVFASLPAASTSFYWVGMDSLTLFLLSILLHAQRNLWVSILISYLLGLQHFEQGVFATLAVAGLRVISALANRRSFGSAALFFVFNVLGLGLGRLTLNVMFENLGFKLVSDRTQLWIENATGLFHLYMNNFFIVTWSALACGWLVCMYVVSKRGSSKWGLSAFMVVGLLSGVLVFDETRVMSIVTLPAVLLFFYQNRDVLELASKKVVSAYSLVWIAVPWLWVFGGVTKHSLIFTDLAWVIRFGGFLVGVDVPADQPVF